MGIADWIVKFYLAHCGPCNEGYGCQNIGFNLSTLDNPGYVLDVLMDASLCKHIVLPTPPGWLSPDDFLIVKMNGCCFHGVCSCNNFEGLLNSFRVTVGKNFIYDESNEFDEDIAQMCRFFDSQCDGDWEHGLGIKFASDGNCGFQLIVHLFESEFEDYEMLPIHSGNPGEPSFLSCRIEQMVYYADFGRERFHEAFSIFQTLLTLGGY